MRKLSSAFFATSVLVVVAALASRGVGQAAASASAPLAFTETPTSTPTATPTDTPIPPPTDTPVPPPTSGPVILDPLITKAVNLYQARAGDAVQYTLTVTNPNSVDVPGVTVVDPLPALVEFLSATTTQGAFAFDAASHTVTFDLGTLSPGQVVVIVIQARLSDKALPPDAARNGSRVCRGSGQCVESNPVVVVVIPKTLPAAGIGPGPREVATMMLWGLALLAVLSWGAWFAWQRARRLGR